MVKKKLKTQSVECQGPNLHEQSIMNTVAVDGKLISAYTPAVLPVAVAPRNDRVNVKDSMSSSNASAVIMYVIVTAKSPSLKLTFAFLLP